jgi:hypothetical protein
MDENGFKRSEEQLLLDLPQPSAAASVTSAHIHSTESQNAPAWNIKCDMQKWLKTHSRSDPTMNEVVLQTEKKRKVRYKTDNSAELKGHTLSPLPTITIRLIQQLNVCGHKL